MRRKDVCVPQLKAQGPSRTCNESKKEEGEEFFERVVESMRGGVRVEGSGLRVNLEGDVHDGVVAVSHVRGLLLRERRDSVAVRIAHHPGLHMRSSSALRV